MKPQNILADFFVLCFLRFFLVYFKFIHLRDNELYCLTFFILVDDIGGGRVLQTPKELNPLRTGQFLKITCLPKCLSYRNWPNQRLFHQLYPYLILTHQTRISPTSNHPRTRYQEIRNLSYRTKPGRINQISQFLTIYSVQFASPWKNSIKATVLRSPLSSFLPPDYHGIFLLSSVWHAVTSSL